MYIMESENEHERLILKSDAEKTKAQLIKAGIQQLKDGAHIIDAGSGSGFVSKIILELLSEKNVKLTLIDLSKERLQAAKNYIEDEIRNASVSYQQTSLLDISDEIDPADFVFSRFVLEYFSESKQQTVFEQLLQKTKPKGKLVIADLDYNLMSHFPEDPSVTLIQKAVIELEKSGSFDPFVGRKLFKLFHDHQLENIQVDVEAHHLFYGSKQSKDIENWEFKFEALKKLTQAKNIDFPHDVEQLRTDFLEFFTKKDTFSYTPMITVIGNKP